MINLIDYKQQKIFVISDTHGHHRKVDIPICDIIIHCGDICNDGNMNEILDFFDWFSNLNIDHKIFVHGNHDLLFELEPELAKTIVSQNVIWLNNSFIKINAINFFGINGFVNEYEIENDLKIDFLITHYPPKGVLDNGFGNSIIRDFVNKFHPIYHVFGHNHDDFGILNFNQTIFINTSVYNNLSINI